MSDVKEVNQIKVAFIADDVKNFTEFDIFYNATFALMLAAQESQLKVLLTESKNLKIVNNKVFAKFDEVILKQEVGSYLKIKNSNEVALDSIEIIFARKDPPINENYIAYIQTLTLVPHNIPINDRFKTLIVNSPEGILKANEKLYALNFPEIIPPTLVTSNKNEILEFLSEYKEMVVKPLFNKGGEGVFYLTKDSKNNNSIIEACTYGESRVALVQKYIPDVIKGDKRIVLLNGEPIGAISRIPAREEFRTSVRRGASVKAYELSKRDMEICKTLKPFLQRDGLYFTSIDVIGDYLIEVNVTCPASLQEVERFTKRPVAKEIVNWAVKAVTHCSSSLLLT